MAAERSHATSGGEKSDRAFRTIGEVSQSLDLPQHVLRFWETRFSQIRPLKRGGNRRYYRPEDIELLRTIKTLLYQEGYTIKGVQKRFREQGVKSTIASVHGTQRPGTAAVPPVTERREDTTEPPPDASPASGPSADERAAREQALEALLNELRTLRQMLD